jgi:anti-sigma-K factor RskA
MSVEMNNHVIDLLPAYVLDALTDEELGQVVEHLATCEVCQTEYRGLQVVADDLPLALAQTAPPARVKTNLMRAIHARQPAAITPAQPAFWHRVLDGMRLRLPAIGLALIAVLAVVNVLLWRQLSLASQQAATHMRVVDIANTQYSPGATGTLVMDANGKYGTLVVDNLPALSASYQYQVWLTRAGVRVSGGVLSVNPDGYASLEIKAPSPLDQYDSIGVTIEPSGGSASPTGDKVLGGDIPH